MTAITRHLLVVVLLLGSVACAVAAPAPTPTTDKPDPETVKRVEARQRELSDLANELRLATQPLTPALQARRDRAFAAWKGDLGQDIKVDASICKVYATEIAGKVVDRCIQMFGGLGVAREMPLERWHREMRIKRIGEGPSEVHRMVVARDLLGGQRKKPAEAKA